LLLHFGKQSTKRIENQSNATNSWYQIKTNNFYRRWDIILFECSTRLLKLLLDDASYQKKGLEKIFSDFLKTSEEQLSTDEFTNICRRLDEIQKLEDTKFSKKRDAKF
jgi:hypothetical protein